jgi:DNA-binding CsgD family transcriptional regulator
MTTSFQDSPYKLFNQVGRIQKVRLFDFSFPAHMWWLGEYRRMRHFLTKNLADAKYQSDEYSRMIFSGLQVLLELNSGNLGQAEKIVKENLGIFQVKNNAWGEVYLNQILQLLPSFQDQVQTKFSEIEQPQTQAFELLQEGRDLILQRQLTTARVCLEQSLEIFRLIGNLWGQAETLFTLAQLTQTEGKSKGGLVLNHAGWQLSRQIRLKPSLTLLMWGLGYVWLSKNEPERAQPFFQDALILSRQTGQKTGTLLAAWGMGEVALYKPEYEPAQTYFKEALVQAFQTGDQYGLVGSIYRLAKVAMNRQDTPRALNLLKRSRAMYQSLNSKPGILLCQSALNELDGQCEKPLPKNIKTGRARPPRPFTLSKRELEVLRLVAAGMSDKQIAEQLILSQYTVSSYLRAIYRKLGVTSRTAATHSAHQANLL